MNKKIPTRLRREESLSRESIVLASIQLLDEKGEGGLTFRALSEKLDTGAGAIYWHVANKSDLLLAACDVVVARIIPKIKGNASPEHNIRDLGLALFDAIDERPWLGSALSQSLGKLPIVRVLEGIGQQLQAMGVTTERQWLAANALLNYILGVSVQNARNSQLARTHALDQINFMQTMAQEWSELDPGEFPFTRSVAGQLPKHDDRLDYVAGMDLILAGIHS